MDQKVLDAGIGEVPSHTVDTNIPSSNGGHNVISDTFDRSSASPHTGISTLPTQQRPPKPFPHGGVTAPTHHTSHVVRELRSR